MNIIILESEYEKANCIEAHLLKIDQTFKITKYCDVTEFNQKLDTFSDYSIFILNIVLPENDGINVARQVNRKIKGASIIFISSEINRVVDIYDVQHCYFIYQPELEKRITLAIDKAIDDIKRAKNSIMIENRSSTIVIALNEILYFERNLRVTIIHLNNSIYRTYDSLRIIKKKVSNNFFECHQSFIVNFDEVREHQRNCFMMKNGTIIPISRSREKEAKEAFQQYLIDKK